MGDPEEVEKNETEAPKEAESTLPVDAPQPVVEEPKEEKEGESPSAA